MMHWTDEWQVFLVGAQLIVLIAAAIFAGIQTLQARKLRETQIRPFVVADFEADRGYIFNFLVSNLGSSMARDVRVKLTPPLESAADVPLNKLKMLNDRIPTLPPGKKIQTFFDTGFARGDSGLPMSYSAEVTYTDEKGKRTFNETYVLDLEVYQHINEIVRHDIHDVHARLEEISKSLGRFARSPASRGILTYSHKEHRAQQRQSLREQNGGGFFQRLRERFPV
jgi:hypothetical protein